MNKRQKKKYRKRYIKEIYSHECDGRIRTDVMICDTFKPKSHNVILCESFDGFPFDDIRKMRGVYKCMNELSISLTTHYSRKKLYDGIYDALKTTGKLNMPLIPYDCLFMFLNNVGG